MADKITNQDLTSVMYSSRFNPSFGLQSMVSLLEDSNDGKTRIVDPSNPFMFLLESAIASTHAMLINDEALTRKQFPSVAVTEEELYLHMSDVDFLNRFGSPSRTTISMSMSIEEIVQKAVEVPNSSMRKIVIPKDSYFTAGGNVFSMQYAIEIRVLAHGGLQIVYDVDQVSPLSTLSSNLVSYIKTLIEGRESIIMTIPVSQYKIDTVTIPVANSGAVTQRFTFTDQYYYCRVYRFISDGVWEEIYTTHTDQVYDPYKPTAFLKVLDAELVVSIPPVYVNTQLVKTSIRVDIYTTKGPMDYNLGALERDTIIGTWRDLDNSVDPIYIVPLSNFSDRSIFSSDVTTGGTNKLTLEELRERIINNSFGSPNLPITNVQISTMVEDMGYTVITNIDNITNRIFQASRKMPLPSNGSTVSGAGTLMSIFQATLEYLGELDTVADNFSRVTILPNTLFKRVDGIVSIVESADVDYILALPAEALISAVNDGNFLYTPFHYVFDSTNSQFDCRGYYLDNPEVISKIFVHENETTLLELSTRSYSIERITDGYRLTIQTRSSESVKLLLDSQIRVQLSYIAEGERYRATLEGVFVGINIDTMERVYTFDIITNYDINVDNFIYLTSFKMFDVINDRTLPTNLITDFELVYIVGDYEAVGQTTSSIDSYIAHYMLTNDYTNYVGVTQERYQIQLGYALSGLWSKSRPIVGPMEYQTYTTDQPYYYPNIVYERDSNGHILMTSDGSGGVTYTVLHNAGDPAYDLEGNQILLHKEGDLILDSNNEPIPVDGRKIVYEASIMFVDGRYYFANDVEGVAYRTTIPNSIVSWLENDISRFEQIKLEQTELYFYPKTTIGNITVLGDDNRTVNIESEQRLSLVLYVDKPTYNNPSLRDLLTTNVKSIIAGELTKSTVSVMNIVDSLKIGLESNIYGMDVSQLKLGGVSQLSTVTLIDNSEELVIGKRLELTDDGYYSIEDDLDVIFTIHKE